MAKSDAFVIPNGLQLTLGDAGLSVHNSGDIEIKASPGHALASLRSTGGDVVVHDGLAVGEIVALEGTAALFGGGNAGHISARAVSAPAGLRAELVESRGGQINLSGLVEVAHISGAVVNFDGTQIRARVIEATESIRIGRCQIQADLLIAPRIELDASATGKITVVESHNDLGPIAVRGCLRLSELEDLGGNANSFLAERGVRPLVGGQDNRTASDGAPAMLPPTPAPVAAPVAPVVPTVQAVQAAPVQAAPVQPAPVQAAPVQAAPTQAAPPEAPAQRSLGEDHLPTLVEVDDDDALPEDPSHGAIAEALEKIIQGYGDAEIPPPVLELAGWVAKRDYIAVRDGITNIWNGLLKHHQRQGLRIQPSVTSAFTQLNSVVRKLKR